VVVVEVVSPVEEHDTKNIIAAANTSDPKISNDFIFSIFLAKGFVSKPASRCLLFEKNG
jgi:hypothetical protein